MRVKITEDTGRLGERRTEIVRPPRENRRLQVKSTAHRMMDEGSCIEVVDLDRLRRAAADRLEIGGPGLRRARLHVHIL